MKKTDHAEEPLLKFFSYAREREAIRIRREVQKTPRPWTDDLILQHYRFCNVFREDDRTTRWFRDYVRGPMRGRPGVLLATVLFRWFNRISTGEAVFLQTSLYRDGPATAWDEYLRCGKSSVLLHAIKTYCGKGPYVTGSYTVLGKRGMTKLPGCLWGVENFRTTKMEAEGLGEVGWRVVAEELLSGSHSHSLEWLWSWLRQFDYLGDFTAYEIVTDLHHTGLLDEASDAMTWANPGPGALRGLNRIHGRELNRRIPRERLIEEMQDVLRASRRLWPREIDGVRTRPWTMREVEHLTCEFDKYERTRLGEGRPRGVFR